MSEKYHDVKRLTMKQVNGVIQPIETTSASEQQALFRDGTLPPKPRALSVTALGMTASWTCERCDKNFMAVGVAVDCPTCGPWKEAEKAEPEFKVGDVVQVRIVGSDGFVDAKATVYKVFVSPAFRHRPIGVKFSDGNLYRYSPDQLCHVAHDGAPAPFKVGDVVAWTNEERHQIGVIRDFTKNNGVGIDWERDGYLINTASYLRHATAQERETPEAAQRSTTGNVVAFESLGGGSGRDCHAFISQGAVDRIKEDFKKTYSGTIGKWVAEPPSDDGFHWHMPAGVGSGKIRMTFGNVTEFKYDIEPTPSVPQTLEEVEALTSCHPVAASEEPADVPKLPVPDGAVFESTGVEDVKVGDWALAPDGIHAALVGTVHDVAEFGVLIAFTYPQTDDRGWTTSRERCPLRDMEVLTESDGVNVKTGKVVRGAFASCPEWAMWKAQDESGTESWFEGTPAQINEAGASEGGWWDFERGEKWRTASKSNPSPNWKDSLLRRCKGSPDA